MRRLHAWLGRNLVPLVLVPLAFLLVWVAIWRIWLPPAGGGAVVARTVTRVDANAATLPTHRVTTVTRTTHGAAPSRRSELVALALIFLGAGAAVIGLFHDRIGSIELGKDGVKIDLTAAEQGGAAALVDRLASAGAGGRLYARALERYVGTVAGRRPRAPAVRTAGTQAGLDADEAAALAARIGDEVL